MKITLESTTTVVEIEVRGAKVPARIWQGKTEKGTPCHAYIMLIAPTIPQPLPADVDREFTTELREQSVARLPEIVVIDMRLIL